MATFPKTEASILILGNQMISGLATHAALYPSVTLEASTALSTAFGQYNAAVIAKTDAKAAAKSATAAKIAAQDALEEEIKKVLYLAEHDCIETPENLDYIGWGGRKTPTSLEKPGSVFGLTPTYEGPGTLSLGWLKPAIGGAVSSYRIERSDQPAGGGIPGAWTLITTSYEPEATLQDQPRGIEMQYRVIATNASGDSMPSNIATVVL